MGSPKLVKNSFYYNFPISFKIVPLDLANFLTKYLKNSLMRSFGGELPNACLFGFIKISYTTVYKVCKRCPFKKLNNKKILNSNYQC